MGGLHWRLGSEGSRSSQLCSKASGIESRPAKSKLQARRSAQHEVGIGRRAPVQLPCSVAICLPQPRFPSQRHGNASSLRGLTKVTHVKGPGVRPRSIWVCLASAGRLSACPAGRRRGQPRRTQSGGDPSPLPDWVERRVSEANQRQAVPQPRVLSHVPSAPGSPPPPTAVSAASPRARPREVGRPLGQCERGAASAARGSPPTDAHPRRLCPPSRTPAPSCANAHPRFLGIGSATCSDWGGRWRVGGLAQRVEVCKPLAHVEGSDTSRFSRLRSFS